LDGGFVSRQYSHFPNPRGRGAKLCGIFINDNKHTQSSSSLGFQPYLQQNVGVVLFFLVKVAPSEHESMAYRVLALTVAAGVSLCSVALAKEHCRVGQVYFRSKHTCVAKGVAVARGIYHAQHQVATKAHGTNIVNRRARARAASAAAPIPLPPIRLMRTDMASTPTRNETADSSGSIEPSAPGNARRSVSPYGALVPVTPAE
jgi:hypothetical protein